MKFKALTMGMLIACTGAAQAATVQEVFNGDMLGTNQRYFESVAGIPRESNGDQHLFRVQNCQITATISSGKVSALGMELAKGCEPDLSSFIGEYAPKPGQALTPGAFGSGVQYTADCLWMCGNAADPSAYASWEAPRAAGALEVLLEIVLVGTAATDAADKWTDQMKQAAGEDYLLDTKFNCDSRFNGVAGAAFKDVVATRVTIGHGLPKLSCP